MTPMSSEALRISLLEDRWRLTDYHLEPRRSPVRLETFDPLAMEYDTSHRVANGRTELRILGDHFGVRDLPGGQWRERRFPELHSCHVLALRPGRDQLFDVVIALAIDDIYSRRFEIAHFEPISEKLIRTEPWRADWKRSWLGSSAWWKEALPAFQGGVPLEILGDFPKPRAMAGGLFIASDYDAFGYRLSGAFTMVSREGLCTGSLRLPPGSYLAGEIQPGLLLAATEVDDPAKIDDRLYRRDAGTFASWTALVIESRTGRILGRLPGLAPSPIADPEIPAFLIGPYGEPYDLEAVDAEPRRILPWRPRGAVTGKENH